MIRVEGVSHAISGTSILSDVSLDIPKGGVTALIGPNGAGKSTLLTLMARLQPLQAGRISFDGLDISHTPTRDLALKLAILAQQNVVGTRLRVCDLVGFGRYPHHRGRPTPEDDALAAQALREFGLEPLAGRFLDELSGGQQQRAFVAMTFAQGTDYLLLDEPLNNLDMFHARSLMRNLREAADRHGRTVVVVLHEINYAGAWADRIIALRDGRIAAGGTPQEVLRPEVLSPLFGMEMRVEEIAGRPLVLHHI